MARPLEENLAELRRRIEHAARAAGRSPGEIRWIGVTKTVEPAVAETLARLGVLDLGESRASELEKKREHLARAGLAPRWHFVGHLQANKARRVVRAADVIHSVDSLALLERIDRIADEEGRRVAVYLQVALTAEATKHGFDADELAAAARRAGELAHVELRGLMAMGPLEAEAGEATRAVFARAAGLRAQLERDADAARAFASGRCELSMGMSDDLELAIAAGADVLRIGGALFRNGARPLADAPAAPGSGR